MVCYKIHNVHNIGTFKYCLDNKYDFGANDNKRVFSFFIDYIKMLNIHDITRILINFSYLSFSYISKDEDKNKINSWSNTIDETEITDKMLLNELNKNGAIIIGFMLVYHDDENNCESGYNTINYIYEFINGVHIGLYLTKSYIKKYEKENGNEIKLTLNDVYDFDTALILMDCLGLYLNTEYLDDIINDSYKENTTYIYLYTESLYDLINFYNEIKETLIEEHNVECIDESEFDKIFYEYLSKDNIDLEYKRDLYKNDIIEKYIC